MIILYNPHVDDFLAEPPHFRFLKRRALKKYGFFISESLRTGNLVNVLIDGTASAFIPEKIFHKLPKFLRGLVAEIEYRLWKRCNNFGSLLNRVQPAVNKSDDVVLAFSYKAATGDFSLRRDLLSRYRAVVFHLSHYFVSTSEKSRNIQSLDNAFLAGDSDIADIAYFKKNFPWYGRQFLVLSFSVAARFEIRKPFSERQNRCVATGSFHDLTQEQPPERYVDYIRTTGATTYHPIRKDLYEAKEKVSELIECRVSPYRQYGATSKFKRMLNHFSVSQKKYFAVDIVDLYNDYRFAVVGEELSGFPALGAFEAMACGCVVLAQPSYYAGLGLEANQHYLPYDGTLDNLISVTAYHQSKDVEQLAQQAHDFIVARFSTAVVYAQWMTGLSNIPSYSATER